MTRIYRENDAIGLPGLYELRVTRGLTRQDIAHHMGVAYVTVWSWELSKHSPSLRNLVKLCRLFHTTPNDLLGFTEHGPAWLREADRLVAAHLH